MQNEFQVCLSKFALDEVWDPEKPDNARLAATLATSGNLPVTAWPIADTVLIP